MSKLYVYHGSNTEIIHPSLSYGRYDADFGIGFYVTQNQEMAEKWACNKKESIINVYELDLDELTGIELLPDKTWLDFVVHNRSGYPKQPPFDLSDVDYFTGPTADDKLFSVAEQYESNLIDADIAVKAMNSMEIGTQISLATDAAIASIQFVKSYKLNPERKKELQELRLLDRKSSNQIVEILLRKRVEAVNLKPGPPPLVHKKKKTSVIKHF